MGDGGGPNRIGGIEENPNRSTFGILERVMKPNPGTVNLSVWNIACLLFPEFKFFILIHTLGFSCVHYCVTSTKSTE